MIIPDNTKDKLGRVTMLLTEQELVLIGTFLHDEEDHGVELPPVMKRMKRELNLYLHELP